MCTIRAFEERVTELYRASAIPGFIHTSLGQEAVAVGVCGALLDADTIATTHRGHGHCLAKGADVEAAMAELFGKVTGLCRGKGGSMHIADPRLGIIGANAIVGASIPIAVGAALSSVALGRALVSVAFFGEGAVNQGAFHEAVNLAAIWQLPVLFVCENNVYAEFTDSRTMSRRPSIAELGPAYGIPAEQLDGNDVQLIHARALEVVAACREGGGPVLLELSTYRWQGHYEGDPQPYKPASEAAEWKGRDPIAHAQARLEEAGSARGDLEAIVSAARNHIAAAEAFARDSPYPAIKEAYLHVYGG